MNIGHSEVRVIEAIQQQAFTLAYTKRFTAIEPPGRRAAKVAEIVPGDAVVVFFTNVDRRRKIRSS